MKQSVQPPKRQKLDLHANGNGQPRHYDIDYNAEDARTSLLHDEVEDLLRGAVLSQQTKSAVEAWIAKLAKAVRDLPQAVVNPYPISSLVKRMNFPISRPFTFNAPESVEIVGSFAYKAALSATNACVDVALVMPKSCFDEKDQLNNRYFAKRALYLAHVGINLLNLRKLGIANVQWSLLCGDPRLPVLLVTTDTNSEVDGKKIRLIPCLNLAAFPLRKLAPEKNNLRSANKTEEGDTGKDSVGQHQVPTPYYNTAILKDMMIVEHAKKLKEMANRVPGFAGASVLLRLWLENNGIQEGGDGITPFLLTMLLLHLLETGKLFSEMRPIQLFRMTLLNFSNSKTLVKDGIKMKQAVDLVTTASQQKPPLPTAWQTAGQEVVFIDMSGWLNLAASVSAAALQQAQYAASNTVALLSASSSSEALDRLFLRRQSLATLYDSWFRIELSPEEEQNTKWHYTDDKTPWQKHDSKIEAVAQRALRSRAKLVRVIRRSASVPTGGDLADFNTCFDKSGAMNIIPERDEILLGIRLDPTTAFKSVDVGPAAEKKVLAAEFRSFWGEKAELRRFQDGKIAESVVWNVSPAESHGIVASIVKYVIHRHVSQSAKVIEISTVLDGVLIRKGHSAEDDIIAERLVNNAATELGKRLRAMEDANLPLRVISTQPLSPVLRHAAVFPPLPHPLAGASSAMQEYVDSSEVIPRCLVPIEILCKLEGSGKWPDDPTAYLKTKAAIGVQLAKALHTEYGLYAQASEYYIDVLSDGFAFRLLLITERESVGSFDPSFRDLLDIRIWQQGLVSQTSGANPSFGTALRLAKRWLASQWLSPHICEEAVELLMVAVYSHSHSSSIAAPPPASPVAGFLQFLILLADHPWNLMPLVLPTNTVEQSSRIGALTSRSADSYSAYDKLKASNAAPAMYIVGPKTNECVLWTQCHPSRAVLHRAVVLARRACRVIQSMMVTESLNGAMKPSSVPPLSPKSLMEAVFAHEETEYDVLIHLRKDSLPRFNQVKSARSKETSKSNSVWTIVQTPEEPKDVAKKTRAVLSGIPIQVVKSRGGAHVRKELLIGFEPVEIYVDRLKQRFSSIGVVCADYCGGSKVGIKLFGDIVTPGQVRPEVAHVLKPKKSNKGSFLTAIDLENIAEDAINLGPGLVEFVEYRNQS